MADTYKTITKETEGLFKDKGSKFFAYGFPLTDESQVKGILQKLKKEHHSARHHCYAYKIGKKEFATRANDDGEPSGTAGKPIFGQIESHEVTNILVVVVRYFGGILLGTSGLINAYKNATIECLANADIQENLIEDELQLNFTYELLNTAMRIVKDENLRVVKQDFMETCEMTVAVKQSLTKQTFDMISSIYGIEVKIK